MASAGSAYVDIMPNMSGFGSELSKGISSAGDGAMGLVKKLGDHMGLLASGGLVVGFAGALVKIGDDFEKAYKIIRVGTGETGKALDGLKESFKNVAKSGPASFNDVATAITAVHQRLGTHGKELEGVAKQYLQVSRITGTDLKTNLQTYGSALAAANIPAHEHGKALDEMFRASQQTGTGMQTLGSNVQRFSVPMTQLGFSFDQQLALFGKFGKEGINTTVVMSGMRKALGTMAKAGEEPVATFKRIVAEIKNTNDPTEAAGKALKLFGARAGPQMSALIRGGKFDIEGLTKTIAGGSETIGKAADASKTWGGAWKTTINSIKVALEPVASWLMEVFGVAMRFVRDEVGKLIDKLGEWGSIVVKAFNEGRGPVDGFKGALAQLGIVARDVWESVKLGFEGFHASVDYSPLEQAMVRVGNAAKTFVDFVKDHWKPILEGAGAVLLVMVSPVTAVVAALVLLYAKFEPVRSVINAIVVFVRDNWQAVLGGAAALILVLVPAFVTWAIAANAAAIATIAALAPIIAIGLAIGVLVGALIYAYNHFVWFRDAVSTVWSAIQTAISGAWSLIQVVYGAISYAITDVLLPVFQTLRSAWETGWGAMKAAIEFVWRSIKAVYDALVAANDWLRDAFHAAGAVIQAVWDGIQSAVTSAWGFVRAAYAALVNANDVMRAAVIAAWQAISDVFNAVVGAIATVVVPAFHVFEAVNHAVWTLVAAVVSDMWRITSGIWNEMTGFLTGIFLSVLSWFKNTWDSVWSTIKDLSAVAWAFIRGVWQSCVDFMVSVFTPVINTFKDTWDSVWSTIKNISASAWAFILVVWDAIVGFVSGVFTATLNVFQSVFGAVWGAIQTAVSAAWNFILPIWDAIVGFLNGPGTSAFNTFGSTVSNVWSSITGAISTAWNTISGLFTSLYDFVATKLTTVWDGFTGAARTAWNMLPDIIGSALRTVGGVVSGFLDIVGTIADAVGLKDVASTLHDGANAAHSWGQVPGHASGAVLASNVGGGFVTNGPRAIVGEGSPLHPEFVIPTDPTHRRRALDLYAALGTQLLDIGGVIGDIGGDVVGGVESGIDWGVGKVSDIADAARSLAADQLEKHWHKFKVGPGLGGLPPSGMNAVRQGVVDAVRGKANEMVKSVAAAARQGAAGVSGPYTGPPPPGGVMDWIAQAEAITGKGADWTQPLLGRVMLESGGDPRAQNNWDSNAMKGTPSKGLVQTIDSTFQQYMLPGHGDIWNPVDNLIAGIRYMDAAYGGIHNINPNIGYAAGGMLPTWHPVSFDRGGVLAPGWNVARNDTGTPETLMPAGRSGPALHIDHAHFAEPVDVDAVLQKTDFMVRAGRL